MPSQKILEKCGACKKRINSDNTIICCSDCKRYFHSNCSSISFEQFRATSSWTCVKCIEQILPFSSLENENFRLTMEAKNLPFGEHISANPSLKIQTLLDKLPGDTWGNGDYICDLTNSKYYTPSEFLSSKLPKDSFSMFHINIASLSLHIDDLRTIISLLDHPFDIIAVSETKIKDGCEPIVDLNIDGYNFEQTPTKSDFGGVGIYVKKGIYYDIRSDLCQSLHTIAESIFVELTSDNNKKLIIGCVYRHHTPIQDFIDNFFETKLLQISKEKSKKCALLGDFNIDLLKSDSDDKTCEFYDLVTTFGFRPLILQPTRVQTTCRSTSATLIDNIFVNDMENTSTGGNITTSISDHFPQFCNIDIF